MEPGLEPLRAAISKTVADLPSNEFTALHDAITEILKDLAKEGQVILSKDYTLHGPALEVRVEQLCRCMGFRIRRGRPGLEDFCVDHPPEVECEDPLVLEVKASKDPWPSIDDLRQLDDWVFDLSGESVIRKRRAPPKGKNIAYMTAGLAPGPDRHPSPHKGVMVFNGPLGTPFDQRLQPCLCPGHQAFVEKRGFCVIPFGGLVGLSEYYARGASSIGRLWNMMHATNGILDEPRCKIGP